METVLTAMPTKLAALAKCAHPACSCTVASGEQYCSDYCTESASADHTAADDTCVCGHAECNHSVGAHGVPAGGIFG